MEKNKKNVAREFLIFSFLLIIILVGYLSIMIYNFYLDKKTNSLTTKIINISIMSDSLSSRYNLYENATLVYDEFGVLNNSYRFMKKTRGDVENENSEWDKYIVGEHIYPPNHVDSINYKKALRLKKEIEMLKNEKIKYLNNKIDQDSQFTFLLKLSITLFVILFPLRYLIYGVKWSIIQLKTK
jgi:hypothetical protein